MHYKKIKKNKINKIKSQEWGRDSNPYYLTVWTIIVSSTKSEYEDFSLFCNLCQTWQKMNQIIILLCFIFSYFFSIVNWIENIENIISFFFPLALELKENTFSYNLTWSRIESKAFWLDTLCSGTPQIFYYIQTSMGWMGWFWFTVSRKIIFFFFFSPNKQVWVILWSYKCSFVRL